MHKRLNKFVEQERCFYNIQFGFYVNCSTYKQCTHANYTEYPDSLRRWQICCRVFVDLKKAFNTVDQDTY